MSRPQEFTVQQILDAIPGTGGIAALVAKKLGCDRATVCRYAKRYVTIREALRQEDEGLTDRAEVKAATLIDAGHWPAILHRLSTKGRDRGYVTRQETEVSGKVEVSLAELVAKVAKEDDESRTDSGTATEG